MVNWLDSTDAVIVFTGSTILQCNRAAVQLFSYQDQQQLLAQTPADLFCSQQTNSMGASEYLLTLLTKSQQEGFCKTKIIGSRADGSTFSASLLIVAETNHPNEEYIFSGDTHGAGLYFCTKWLPVPKDGPDEYLRTERLQEDGGFDSENLRLLSVNSEKELVLTDDRSTQGITLNKIMNNTYEMKSKADSTRQHGVTKDQISAQIKNKSFIKLQATINEEEGNRYIPQMHVQEAKTAGVNHQPELERLKLENQNLRRMLLELNRPSEKFKVLAEYSPDIIMQFDRQHRHIFVNTQVENYLPYRVEEYLGKTHAELGLPEELTSLCQEAISKVFNTGQRLQLELELPNSIWVDWVLIPEFGTSGEIISVVTTARDITEKKQTAIELQKSQQKLKDAFEITKLSSWEYSITDDCLLLNHQLKDLLGIRQPLEVLSGKQFCEEFLLPEEQGKLRYLLRTAVEFTQSCFKEVINFRIRRADGTIIHVLSSIRLEISDSGKIVEAFGTAQDITQLRLTEQELEEYRTGLEQLVETRTQELRKSEEKLADALRLANLGTWEFDPVADCFLVSNTVLEILGISIEKEGSNIISVYRMRESIHPDDRIKYHKTVEKVKQAGIDAFSDHLELRITRSDGEVRYLYVSIKITKTRNFIKYYGTLQDISGIRHTEHEKDRLTAIIETTSDIVSIAGVDGHMLYLNKAGREFFGISNSDNLQKKTIFNFETARFTKAISRRELKHADIHGTWSGQNCYLRHDGSETHVSQVVISHKNTEGQVECYSTILRDMTAQKKIEQDLTFKNNELDTFIYRASHDLRGPIATLLGLNQIVKHEIEDQDALEYFELYHSQSMRLHNITVSLIELTNIKDRKCKGSLIDVKMLWKRVQARIAMLAESTEVALQENFESIQNFKSDAHLLEIILYNLVENSIRYRRSEVDSFVRLEILSSREAGWITIKVSDNGIGIDNKLQHKIYNMFFRGTDRSKGPGLGLYILKYAVEKLGGRISLYSVPYKGTTFKIELPSMK